ncbi:MAG: dolichyl-phosphate beta-glucosyltransferase [Terriglobia bacterium]
MSEPFLSVVIPAYNEAARIGASLEAIRKYLAARRFPSEIIVVDDGSTDTMPALLSKAARDWPELRVLRHEPNRGKGYSVRRGVLDARGTYVLFTDADLSAPIEEADKLLAALQSCGADAAAGSRALDRRLVGVRQAAHREWSGRAFNVLVRALTGLPIRDTQCGFKLFHRSTTRRSFELQRAGGFGFDPELLFLIRQSGLKIIEVPVRWNNDRATKVRLLRDSTRMFRELVELRWRLWTGGYRAM